MRELMTIVMNSGKKSVNIIASQDQMQWYGLYDQALHFSKIRYYHSTLKGPISKP